jgi:hypothetical protein
LSKEYGWTTEYILSRTLKEIIWRVETINSRIFNERKLNATLHGKEYKMREEIVLDDKTEETISNLIESRKRDGRR